jgi:hypothetical protein
MMIRNKKARLRLKTSNLAGWLLGQLAGWLLAGLLFFIVF